MTFELTLDQVRRDNMATCAILRSVPDPLALLQSGFHTDRESGDVVPTAWWLWSGSVEDGGPLLVIGVRADRGVLKWHQDRQLFVPRGTSEDGEWHEYWSAGDPLGFYEAAEVPVEYVWAAVGEFIGTGQRPTVIDWVDADTIDYRRDTSLDEEDGEMVEFLRIADAAAAELGVEKTSSDPR